jgi:predicted ABC-type ATPase
VSNPFARRPLLVAIAGPNGAGKTTFYQARLRDELGLAFVNADEIAREHKLDPYTAAEIANRTRREHLRMAESFVFETVFSDPEGEKVDFLLEAVEHGYHVVLCFIALPTVQDSDQRVAMRVMQGGHDVPFAKLEARFVRTGHNLQRALTQLPNVIVYDNSALDRPYREVLRVVDHHPVDLGYPPPAWLPLPAPLRGLRPT